MEASHRRVGVPEALRPDLPRCRRKRNHTVCGYEVDAFWPQAKLVVELDGYAAHCTRRAFHSDRQRDRRLVRAGFRPIRLTAGDLRRERLPAEELRELLRS